MADDHTPDRAGGAIEISIVNNRVQLSSRDPTSGQLDFCIHFERLDALAIGRGLVASADEVPIQPGEDQARLARAFYLGQLSLLDELRRYSAAFAESGLREETPTKQQLAQLFVAFLHEMERALAERVSKSPAASIQAATSPPSRRRGR